MTHQTTLKNSIEQKEPVSKALMAVPGGDGFYLLTPRHADEELFMAQRESKWYPEQIAAERMSIAIAERTGIAVFVVRVVSKVVPYHQDWTPSIATPLENQQSQRGVGPVKKWTRSMPTAPGWYWHSEMGAGRCSSDAGPFAVLVEDDGGDVLVGWVPTMDFTEPLTNTEAVWVGQWWGPIDRPSLC